MAWGMAAHQEGLPASLHLAQSIMTVPPPLLNGLPPTYKQPLLHPSRQSHQLYGSTAASPMSVLGLGASLSAHIPALPTAATYGSPTAHQAAALASPILSKVSIKLFGCTPAELPVGLRDHLM